MQLAACAGGALALAVAAYYVRQHPHTVARVRKLLQLQPHRQQRHRSRTEQLGPIGGTTEEQLSDEARPALHALESVRQTAFDAADAAHAALLQQLWQHTKPGSADIALQSEQWTEIGFQGDNPATDFRGMGLLGLHAIVHVARHHGDLLQRVQRAPDDRFHYPYAIGGINIASTVLNFLRSQPALANRLLSGADDALPIFLELLAQEWLYFDETHTQHILEYLRDGGDGELCVMQFEEIRRKYVVEQHRRWSDWFETQRADAVIARLRDQASTLAFRHR